MNIIIKNKLRRSFYFLFSVISLPFFFGEQAAAQQSKLVVHLAKLEIDSTQLDSYKAALKDHAETAIRVEPG